MFFKLKRKKWGHRRDIKFYINIVIIFLIFIAIYSFIVYKFKPTVIAVSDTVAKDVAVRTIDRSINEKVLKGIKYQDLINVRTDKNGKISMLQANTIEMNMLATKITQEVQNNLNNLGSVYVKIPLGTLISSDIFANIGPRIKVGLLPIGAVTVDFNSEFQPAGINQTRHIIYLHIRTYIQIIAPLASDKVEVTTHMPVTDSIIVGDVPGSYVDVNGNKYTVPVPNGGNSNINIEGN